MSAQRVQSVLLCCTLLIGTGKASASSPEVKLPHVQGQAPAGWTVKSDGSAKPVFVTKSPGNTISVLLSAMTPVPPKDELLTKRPGVVAAAAPLQYFKRMAGAEALKSSHLAYAYMTVNGVLTPAASLSRMDPKSGKLTHAMAFVFYHTDVMVYGMVLAEALDAGPEGDVGYHKALREAYSFLDKLRIGKR